MNDPGGTPQAGAPAPGWYHDEQGMLRWWDGSGWTEHVQLPPQVPPAPGFAPTPTPPPPSAAAGGSAGPNYLPWVIALVSVVALCIAAVLIVGSLGGDDEGSDTDVVPAGEVEDIQSGLRSAQTAIETWAVDHDGSYSGATPADLAAIEPSISEIALTVSGQDTGYSLSAPAGDVTFTITRDMSGVVVLSCTPPGGDGCDDTGTWGLPT